ncbi:MAG: hypothetical protein JNG86_06925 [Verrucomicrobiaceae bacterium]|nr:hypothetical protein [Verrucomicrobiaceae bacterium]
MKFRLLLSLSLLASLGLSSCTNTSTVTLDYLPPPGGLLRGTPEFSVGAFANKRGIDSHVLGTVRLPVGVTVDTVQTEVPVEGVVANAFAHALHARGMLTDSGKARYLVTGDVLNLDTQLLVHPYAFAKVRLNVVEMGSGRVLFSKVYTGERQSTAYRPGSGSPIPLLQELTSRALQDAVDRAVDDPALRAQLGGGGFRPRYAPGML